MRIEDTAFLCDRVEDSIRRQIPGSEVSSIIDNIGLPYSGINLSYQQLRPGRRVGRRHSSDAVAQTSSDG